MPNVIPVNKPNPYAGTYLIVYKDCPEKVIETREISSQEEFKTILDEVIKYNNAFGNTGPLLRKLLKAENK